MYIHEVNLKICEIISFLLLVFVRGDILWREVHLERARRVSEIYPRLIVLEAASGYAESVTPPALR